MRLSGRGSGVSIAAAPRRFSDTERQAARGLAAVAVLALANAHLQAETVLSLAAASAASEIIHRQRDYSAALVASMQDGLTVLSSEGRLTAVSPSFWGEATPRCARSVWRVTSCLKRSS